VNNSAAGSGGGAILSNTNASGSVVKITNCIFWGNKAAGVASQISQDGGSGVSVTYSDIQGDGFTGAGNINNDPTLLDPNGVDGFPGTLDDNLRLSSNSPCIDAGDSAADIDVSQPGIQPLPTTDLELHARRMNDPNQPDVSGQSCPVVDMGAYEVHGLCGGGQCTRGDGNGDGIVNGLDIQPLVNCLVSSSSSGDCQCYDMDLDCIVTVDADVPCFVAVLLGASDCVVSCEQTGLLRGQDCNSNGISDVVDIAKGTSQDCNHNFIPDECDIADSTSQDLNENGIPDECEPDCNKNGIPDDKDIADCDPNDPNQVWCRDCNGNGVPDECERDCNNNGIPDDCDIADETSLDCNGNLVPDECDLQFAPPRGSLDCNENGIPDECDIATGYSQDCNGNGFPDECDIASQVSLDENENGIPDECEEEQNGMYGGGFNQNSFMSGGFDDGTGGSGSVADRLEAWAEFHEWCQSQSWGPDAETSGTEQFQQMTDKMRELGLPVRDVWHRVRTNAAE
jgi:hypothetical protein